MQETMIMNVKCFFAGLVLAATVLVCGCAHDCCRPRPVTSGRPFCPASVLASEIEKSFAALFPSSQPSCRCPSLVTGGAGAAETECGRSHRFTLDRRLRAVRKESGR